MLSHAFAPSPTGKRGERKKGKKKEIVDLPGPLSVTFTATEPSPGTSRPIVVPLRDGEHKKIGRRRLPVHNPSGIPSVESFGASVNTLKPYPSFFFLPPSCEKGGGGGGRKRRGTFHHLERDSSLYQHILTFLVADLNLSWPKEG